MFHGDPPQPPPRRGGYSPLEEGGEYSSSQQGKAAVPFWAKDLKMVRLAYWGSWALMVVGIVLSGVLWSTVTNDARPEHALVWVLLILVAAATWYHGVGCRSIARLQEMCLWMNLHFSWREPLYSPHESHEQKAPMAQFGPYIPSLYSGGYQSSPQGELTSARMVEIMRDKGVASEMNHVYRRWVFVLFEWVYAAVVVLAVNAWFATYARVLGGTGVAGVYQLVLTSARFQYGATNPVAFWIAIQALYIVFFAGLSWWHHLLFITVRQYDREVPLVHLTPRGIVLCSLLRECFVYTVLTLFSAVVLTVLNWYVWSVAGGVMLAVTAILLIGFVWFTVIETIVKVAHSRDDFYSDVLLFAAQVLLLDRCTSARIEHKLVRDMRLEHQKASGQ